MTFCQVNCHCHQLSLRRVVDFFGKTGKSCFSLSRETERPGAGKAGDTRLKYSMSTMLPRLSSFILISLLVLMVQGSPQDLSKASPAPCLCPPLGDPSWDLGQRLYQVLQSDFSSVNTLFSPVLMASSPVALGEGSAGTTGYQLQNLLKTLSDAKAGELLSVVLKSLTRANGNSYHLHTSSALFSKHAPPVSQKFVKKIQAKFNLQHQPLGKGDSKANLKQLHGWAKAGLGGLEGAPLPADIQMNA